MSKKVIYLCSFVLVLGLALTSIVEAADPSLIGWWKFDGDTLDYSGFGNDGTAFGNPTFVDGKFGSGALDFDGNDYVRMDGLADDITDNDCTFSAWVKTTDSAGDWFSCNTGTGGNVALWAIDSSQAAMYEGGYEARSTTNVSDGQWHMLTFTRAGSLGTTYVDGVAENTYTANFNFSATDRWSIAQEWDTDSPSDFLTGTVDDVRFYNRALTQEEIQDVMLGIPPGSAFNSSPANEATDVPREVTLSWTPGEFAAPTNGHKVYFGESFNDVNDGIGGITQDANSYTPPQRLDFNTTYYWRVDEVNAPPTSTVFEGNVWSFTTEPVAYAIAGNNITATASSTYQAEAGPENTINGSGLDVNDMHSTLDTAMWLSGEEKEPNRAWIEYELDKVHKLHEMWAWNSNQTLESIIGFGFNDVTIEYSTNGTDYTILGTTHEFARGSSAVGYAHNTTVDFGSAAAKYIRLTANSNWGEGLTDRYGLSEVRFFSIPVFAKEPSPDSGTTDVAVDVTLSFRAGREAVTHDVYLSTDEQAVIDGNAPVTIVTETSYGPLSLDLGETYYWKVNEVNMADTTTTWQGDIWNFSTQEFLVVDDFEDYNDYSPDEIWSTWIDGYGIPTNGATAGYPEPIDFPAGEHYMATTIVHGGEQSMPFFYDNTGTAAYSEAERTFAVPQDWTKAGVQTLVLWFRGTAGNTGQMYVKINGSKVVYDGDAADMQRAWQPWNIDLALFGTNLQSVTTLAIGIDDNGASGTLYFDDSRLYSYSREFITPTEPSSVGLVGHWKFDGDTLDSSGLGNHGTANGGPTYVVGQTGQAMSFDGIDDYVAIDDVADDITNNDITLTAWVNMTADDIWYPVISCNTAGGDNEGWLAVDDGYGDFGPVTGTMFVADNDWHHLAYTRIGDSGSLYVDGALEGTDTPSFNFTTPSNLWSIGQEWDGGPVTSNFLIGTVDEARIYDYALSHAEVAWLAGRTLPFDKPF